MNHVTPPPNPSPSQPAEKDGANDVTRFHRYFMLGLWAANELRMDDADAEQYAAEVARYGERAVSDEAVVNVVRADIAAYNGDIGDSIIWRTLHRFRRHAAREIPLSPFAPDSVTAA